jgi:hypothetical protein
MTARKVVTAIFVLFFGWFLISYLAVPMWWKHWELRHPGLAASPRITTTGAGISGDPLNVAVIVSEAILMKSMLAAHWFPADPITLKSSFRITESTVFHRPYEDAPVSNLYLFGRKEDLAFEKPVGEDARRRHHVRFWKAPLPNGVENSYWLGAITFDRSVGFSHTTGQITHHIAPEIDLERDALIADLRKAGRVAGVELLENYQVPHTGRNGGGDRWETDGRLAVISLSAEGASQSKR